LKVVDLKTQSKFIPLKHIAKTKQMDLQRRKAKLREAAQQFEAIFLSYILKTMRQSIPKGGLFPQGLANNIYNSMFNTEVAKQLAKRNEFGLADILFRQLAGKLQMHQNNATEQPKSIRPTIEKLKKFQPIIHKASKKYSVSQNLIYAIIHQESGGNPQAISPKGAKGLMQLMDQTAKELGVVNVWDPEENILAGVKYFRWLLNEFNGDVNLALAAYNAGPENVKRYGGIPPFKETQHYVQKVLDLFEHLRQNEVTNI